MAPVIDGVIPTRRAPGAQPAHAPAPAAKPADSPAPAAKPADTSAPAPADDAAPSTPPKGRGGPKPDTPNDPSPAPAPVRDAMHGADHVHGAVRTPTDILVEHGVVDAEDVEAARHARGDDVDIDEVVARTGIPGTPPPTGTTAPSDGEGGMSADPDSIAGQLGIPEPPEYVRPEGAQGNPMLADGTPVPDELMAVIHQPLPQGEPDLDAGRAAIEEAAELRETMDAEGERLSTASLEFHDQLQAARKRINVLPDSAYPGADQAKWEQHRELDGIDADLWDALNATGADARWLREAILDNTEDRPALHKAAEELFAGYDSAAASFEEWQEFVADEEQARNAAAANIADTQDFLVESGIDADSLPDVVLTHSLMQSGGPSFSVGSNFISVGMLQDGAAFDPDVMAHEYTHAVVDSRTSREYAMESGPLSDSELQSYGVSESIADSVALLMGDDTLVGEIFQSGGVRDALTGAGLGMQGPLTIEEFNEQADDLNSDIHWSPHMAASLPNRATFDIAGLIGKESTAAIVARVADELYMRSGNMTYEQYAVANHWAAIELYGSDSDQARAVREVWGDALDIDPGLIESRSWEYELQRDMAG